MKEQTIHNVSLFLVYCMACIWIYFMVPTICSLGIFYGKYYFTLSYILISMHIHVQCWSYHSLTKLNLIGLFFIIILSNV